jgi:NTP pyrophosphatase (non-canonical NTP hydrolase)
MHEHQKIVETFIEDHDLAVRPVFRILDVLAEAGEIAADAAKSADYGEREEDLRVARDEIGDALFSLLALASRLDMDAESALNEALEKYRTRATETGRPGSGA